MASFVSTATSTVLGALVDSAAPGAGTAISIPASVLFDKAGKRLIERADPHRLNWELQITGLALEDLFYLKNRRLIDCLGHSFQQTAQTLANTSLQS